MPCSNDIFTIMEIGTLQDSHTFFKSAILIPSSPELFLALNDLMILLISKGSVGLKYNDFGFGAVVTYDFDVLREGGIASAYCFPIFAK